MDDNEINRRVAEIEGFKRVNELEWLLPEWWANYIGVDNIWTIPFTGNWLWCGPLIEKYELDLIYYRDDESERDNEWLAHTRLKQLSDKNLKRAICLAVIEINGKNN